jgi:hypothetical protein
MERSVAFSRTDGVKTRTASLMPSGVERRMGIGGVSPGVAGLANSKAKEFASILAAAQLARQEVYASARPWHARSRCQCARRTDLLTYVWALLFQHHAWACHSRNLRGWSHGIEPSWPVKWQGGHGPLDLPLGSQAIGNVTLARSK